MSDHSSPLAPEQLYLMGMDRNDIALTEQLDANRAAFEAGHISAREFADKRIISLVHHLAECQRLRERYLES